MEAQLISLVGRAGGILLDPVSLAVASLLVLTMVSGAAGRLVLFAEQRWAGPGSRR